MLKTIAFGAACLLLAAVPASAQDPVVRPAYLQSEGVISFDPPAELAWDSLVPARLRREALERDPARLRELWAARNEYTGTEITFALPVAPDLARRYYYLLDSTGIHALVPTRLLGTVRLGWADSTPQIASLTVFGALEAPAPPTGHGGFVLAAERPLELRAAPVEFTPDSLLAPRGGTYPGQGTPFRLIVRQYLIHLSDDTADDRVWVQWAPDTAMVEGGCTYRYSLFRLQPAPESVGSTDYGCDL